MTAPTRFLLAFGLVWAAGTGPWSPALAQGPDPVGDPQTDATLADLAAAGQPLGADEISDLHTEAGGDHRHGALQVRWSAGPGRPVPTVRLAVNGGGLSGRLRWRRQAGSGRGMSGALALAGDRWRLGAGFWGLGHGFGLLLDRPGRGRSAGAVTSLAMPHRRPAPWTGGASPRAVQGVLGELGADRLGLRVLAGRRSGVAGTCVAVQIRSGGDRWQAALAALSDRRERGASVAVTADGGNLTGGAEAALRRVAGARMPVLQVATHVRWRPGRRVTCELLSGWAQPGPDPVLGRRVEVAPAPGGRGWIARAAWRPRTAWSVALLARERRGVTAPERGTRERDQLQELVVRGHPADGWTVAGRLRADRTTRATWTPRYPWLVAQDLEVRARRLVAVQVGRQAAAWRWRAGWRQLRDVREQAGSRGLWDVTGWRLVGGGWRLRGGWTEAWGEPVDLVTAIVPLRGLVLPRHWGRWRSGLRVGVQWEGRGWSVQAAAERRLAPQGDPEWRGWLEAAWTW